MRAGRAVLGFILVSSLLTTGCWERVNEEDQRNCQRILDLRMVAKAGRTTARWVKFAANDWIRYCSNGKMSRYRAYRTFPLLERMLADHGHPSRQLRYAMSTLKRAGVVQRELWEVRNMLHAAAVNGVLSKEEYAYLHTWLNVRRNGVARTSAVAQTVFKRHGLAS